MCVCEQVQTSLRVCTAPYVYVRVHSRDHVILLVSMSRQVHICLYVQDHVHVCAYVCVCVSRTSTCMLMFVCVCVCIEMCVCLSLCVCACYQHTGRMGSWPQTMLECLSRSTCVCKEVGCCVRVWLNAMRREPTPRHVFKQTYQHICHRVYVACESVCLFLHVSSYIYASVCFCIYVRNRICSCENGIVCCNLGIQNNIFAVVWYAFV